MTKQIQSERSAFETATLSQLFHARRRQSLNFLYQTNPQTKKALSSLFFSTVSFRGEVVGFFFSYFFSRCQMFMRRTTPSHSQRERVLFRKCFFISPCFFLFCLKGPFRDISWANIFTYLDKEPNKKGDKERHQSSMGYRHWKTWKSTECQTVRYSERIHWIWTTNQATCLSQLILQTLLSALTQTHHKILWLLLISIWHLSDWTSINLEGLHPGGTTRRPCWKQSS